MTKATPPKADLSSSPFSAVSRHVQKNVMVLIGFGRPPG